MTITDVHNLQGADGNTYDYNATSGEGVRVTRAGTTVPNWLADKFEGLDDDAETRKLVAATVAAGQVQKLAKHGVDTFHFYTMNRADLVFAISHLLGIRPNGAQKAA